LWSGVKLTTTPSKHFALFQLIQGGNIKAAITAKKAVVVANSRLINPEFFGFITPLRAY
jgi:hypothetical protein